jgi:hypothetical protein
LTRQIAVKVQEAKASQLWTMLCGALWKKRVQELCTYKMGKGPFAWQWGHTIFSNKTAFDLFRGCISGIKVQKTPSNGYWNHVKRL